MLEEGYVKFVKDDSASIMFKRKSGCGDSCAHCKSGCSSLNSVVDIKNTLNAAVGDKVQVSLDTKSFFKMAIWTYGLPILMTILGIIIGYITFPKLGFKNYELLSSLLGLIFLTVSFLLLSSIDKKLSKNKKYSLYMVQITEKALKK